MVRSWVPTNSRVRLALLVLVAAVVAPVTWYLGAPLVISKTVDEGPPAGETAAESRPANAGAGQSADAASEPTGLVLLGSGQFGAVDAIHKGEGTATVFRLPDGQLVLRLENFRVTNGPDLYVYLSAHPAPREGRQLHEGPALEVARLKGNVGNQNYELPAGVGLTGLRSIVVYCKQFSVVFSTAELAPPV